MSGENFLVVIDPATEDQPALDRAIQSAHLTHGRIQLFLSVWFEDKNKHQDADKDLILRDACLLMASCLKKVADTGLEVSSDVVWHQDWGRAVIDAATRLKSYMIFKSSHIRTSGERSKDTMEWTLLREAPCPVMLMHNNRDWKNRRVLAAVNLAATDQAHKTLNKEVINLANSFAKLYQSEVHFVNAVNIEKQKPLDDDALFFASAVPAEKKSKSVKLDLNLLKQECHCEHDEQVHLDIGDPTDVILGTADRVEADLIILGTVARKGIKGKIVGNMAEKILDQTECDILTLNHNPMGEVTGIPFS